MDRGRIIRLFRRSEKEVGHTAAQWMLSMLIGIAFVTDMRTMKIPNAITFTAAILGLLLHTAAAGWGGLLYSAAGLAAGFGCVLLLYVLNAVGAGDVKLFAAIGAVAGAEFALGCLMYSIVYAGAAAVWITLLRKQAGRQIRRMALLAVGLLVLRETAVWNDFASGKERIRFPFMVAVVPGAVTASFVMTG